MKKLILPAMAGIVMGVMFTGCGTTGLTDAAKENVPTRIWYDNAELLVKANDPDLKADTFIGVPALDAVVDTVKDILVQVPTWTVTKVEEKHFRNAYMESAKSLNAGSGNTDLVVKGEAFKTTLLMDVFAGEVAQVEAAAKLPKEKRKAIYEKNSSVYKAAENKVVEYANNHIYAFESCADDAAREKFFKDGTRKQWNAKTEGFVAKIRACVAKANNEAEAKAGIAKLCKEMGVQEMNWTDVGKLLAQDLEKMLKAIQDFANAMQSNQALQQKIAAAAFGGEIVPGTSGKETLAVISRVGKQLKVNAELIKWLIKELAI